MVFLTNNFELPALVVAELYRRRWDVEEYQPHYTSSACFYRLAA
jgi:hypothetical protein